jgi:hypothetical protein
MKKATHLFSAREVIEALGGQTRLAASLGTNQPQVAYWQVRGYISPFWMQATQLLLAKHGFKAAPKVFAQRGLS